MVTDRGQVPYVTIVGLGALGSHLVLFARNWKASLRIIDFDRVESKNTQSQFHTKMGLRKNKAVALGASMRGLWGSSMDTVPHKLTYQSADSQLGGSDLVIDCTDNLEARKEIQDYCVLMDIACLHGCIWALGHCRNRRHPVLDRLRRVHCSGNSSLEPHRWNWQYYRGLCQ